MLFNSLAFAIFFPIVTLIYFLLPGRLRPAWLLAASAYFYMAFVPIYIVILLFTIAVDYVAGLAIASAEGRRRRTYLIVSLVANIGVLAIFKYYNFFNDNLTTLLHGASFQNPIPRLDILLPIGLSFHTFQSMSYTIEVYRGAAPPERRFDLFALYVLFYPQLVAGPIERPQNLLHQFHETHTLDAARVSSGLRLMLWGLIKKVVIADRLAAAVDAVYANPSTAPSLAVTLATYFFAFQIYCDFSGYSDIARGAARVMGYDLMLNFRRPYVARSVSEFWRRWHISLSTWFKDYLYVPLGGNRGGDAIRARNLFLVFVISGLWHGANWTFIAWGALHGAYLVFAIATRALREKLAAVIGLSRAPRLHAAWQTFLVFHLATFAWIFFRARSIADAWTIAGHLGAAGSFEQVLRALALSRTELALALVSIGFLVVVDWLAERGDWERWIAARATWQRWTLYYIGILALVFLSAQKAAQFIYFQF